MFDYVLNDSAKPALLKDRINYEVMGTNEWKHVHTLNKINNDTIIFYLNNNQIDHHYKPESHLPPTPGFIEQEIDFKERSDNSYGHPWKVIDSSLDISNGLSFFSMPFDKPFELNGSFFGKLNVSINKKDFDLSVTIFELKADETYFRLLGRSNLIRASYSKNRSQRRLLEPGKVESIPVNNSFFTSKRINAGSRLVLVLCVNKNPNWQINYGTGKEVSTETIDDAKIPLKIKWYNNSFIEIPVLK